MEYDSWYLDRAWGVGKALRIWLNGVIEVVDRRRSNSGNPFSFSGDIRIFIR